MHSERIHISDLQSETIYCACEGIAQFTVGLTRNVLEENTERLRLIGTGTLVTVDGLHCILTAGHVLDQLRDSDRLGLLSSFAGGHRRHAFEVSHLQIHRSARGEDESTGPDLGLVVLPQTDIGFLLSEKSFFNIDKRRARFSDGFIEANYGFWFTLGIVGESAESLDPIPGFIAGKGYWALCGTFGAPLEYESSEYAYLEVQVDYRTGSVELPSDFGGFSGAGVWQVPLRRSPGSPIEPEEFVLSGVVFYQTAVEDGVRRLRCHGRKTVYGKVPEFLDRSGRSCS